MRVLVLAGVLATLAVSPAAIALDDVRDFASEFMTAHPGGKLAMSEPGIVFAGDHMRVEHDGDKTIITFDDKGTGRVCGSCTLCCRLLPVVSLQKAAGVRCQHQRHGKGCSIYPDRPLDCRAWACRWLADPETAGMHRPDRVHYVIDTQEDYITLRYTDAEPVKVGVVQVWCDPAFPDAHRDPPLRFFMLAMAEKHRMATIVRYDSKRAFVVFPPPICEDRQWHDEHHGTIVNRTELDLQVQRLAEEAEMIPAQRAQEAAARRRDDGTG